MKQTYINSSRRKDWIQIGFLALLLGSAPAAFAQEGTQGNTTVFNGGEAAFFGQHTFVAGGAGTQPGIIKTIRTAPFGIVSYVAGANHTGATDANHVDGYVGKYGTTAFTFPIGSGTKLRPVSISAPASGMFKAAYFAGSPNTATLPAGAPFPVANMGAGVSAVSTVEYWDIDGPSAVNVTLTWDAASGLAALAGATLGNLVVAGYNPSTSKWESLGNAGGTTGTLAATGTVTANGVTPDTYSAFTFAVGAAGTPDLRPFMVMENFAYTNTETTKPFTLRIRNTRTGTTATDPIIVRIYKPTIATTVTLSGVAASDWSIVNSGLYYTLTSNVDIPAAGLGYAITGNIIIPASSPTGAYPLRTVIPDLSGGEAIADNGNNTATIQLLKN